jgi:multidrug transporter EmrE-like cation transporter
MPAMAQLDIGSAHPLMAPSFVPVPVGATLLFGEPPPKIQIVALAFIIIGVTPGALVR